MKTAQNRSISGGAALKIFVALAGVLILLLGLTLAWKGVKKMRGRSSAEFQALLQQSDTASGEGRRFAQEAQPLFQKLMNDVDSLGLEAFRAQHAEAAAKTSALFGSSVEQFRIAQRKIEESKSLNKNGRIAPFLDKKAESYDLIAQTLEVNRSMIGMLVDPSLGSAEALMPKLTEAASRRDALDKEALAASNEATAIAAEVRGGRAP